MAAWHRYVLYNIQLITGVSVVVIRSINIALIGAKKNVSSVAINMLIVTVNGNGQWWAI